MLAFADHRIEAGTRVSRSFSVGRLALFLGSATIIIACFKTGAYTLGNLLVVLSLASFLIVAGYHNRLEQRMHRWRLWRDIKRRHLARLQLDWAALPEYPHAAPHGHPYATDLDLVGPHSLLHLLDTTVSSNGRERLTEWLLTQPPHPGGWQERQQLVHTLVPLTRLRDRLVLEGLRVGEDEINGTRLRAVLLTPAGWPSLVPLLLTESVLALATPLLLAARLVEMIGDYWLLSFGLYAFLFLFMDRSEHSFEHALSLQDGLQKLGAVLKVLERHAAHRSDALGALCRPLVKGASAPSDALRQAARVVAGLSVRANPLAHVLMNVPGPWDLYFTWRLTHLQSRIRTQVPMWLDVLAEVEAAGALAAFAWRHPSYVWPTLSDAHSTAPPPEAGGSLTAHHLAHPLLPATERIGNDLTLAGAGRIVLLTGSNMSGKSTLLRTIGINVCLAQAGAPVCADRFIWSWFRVECCIRVSDSIETGLSHFYAEVKRLKALLETTQRTDAAPTLFLIDEIFRGTNNRERLIGSRAYITALAASRGLGLVTTHDLELADLEGQIPRLSNMHFQETVENGRLRFDYRLRTGPCPTTNALRIMAMEGLPTGKQ